MHKNLYLGALFILCIFLPYLFKIMEGLEYSTKEIDMLKKSTEESSLLENDYDKEQKHDPDKGQVVSRLQSHAKEDPNAPKRQLFSRE
jgi:hypothetical protein